MERAIERLSRAGVLVELVPGKRILRLMRNEEPFSSVREMIGVLETFQSQIKLVDRSSFSLLVDTRRVPQRSDSGFERAFRHFRERIADGFTRIAVLVSSNEGLAQARSHAAEMGPHVEAFADEEQAMAWLEEATDA